MSLTLRYAARSDRGLIREGNEDSVYAGPRLLAVADGMGGMAAGEVASNIVVSALAPLDDDVSSEDLVDALRRAISDANQQLRHAVEENPALEGMGTTLTAMLFSGSRIALVHVGDSRAYAMRAGELTQITRDDTYVQMLVDEGRITSDEASIHPQRSLLTRAMDGRDVDPEFSVREAHAGDRYLLCSDGLSGVVSPETIAEALALEDPRAAADRLIHLALRGGGPDNITCIVADIIDDVGDVAPVVGGAAAGDRTTSAGADTAAGRAALASPSRESAEEPLELPRHAETNRRRHWIRISTLLLLAVSLAGIGGYAGWYYLQRQYYIGPTSSGNVAIYRGIAGSVAGITLSSLETTTDLHVADLEQVVRQDVQRTITATSRADANAIIDRLRAKQLALCPTATTTTPTPTPTPTPTGLSPSPRVEVSESPLPTPTAEPGVTCREPR
jgi:serine/threonine protein phosphatase PrpC